MSETLNWCEIGPTKTPRFDVLSQFLTSQGIQNQFTFVEADDATLGDKILEVQKQKQIIRFHPKNYDKISTFIQNNLRDLEALKAIDTLMYDSKNGYWPAIILREAVFEYLTQKVKNLDVMQKAFIVGTCGTARACIAALVKLGFSKINITGGEDQEGQALIADFKEIFFNVAFEYTKRSDVTILPGVHGLVVNTFSVLESEIVPVEIYYFNFLKKGGLVIDMIDVPVESPFTKIANDIGAQVVAGYEISAFYDLLWVEKVTGRKLDLAAYQALLKTGLEQVSYDKNKVQKILEEFQM